MGRNKKYLTDEERIEAIKEQNKKWKEINREKQRASVINWEKTHPLEKRANYLIQAYNREDKKRGRGKGNLTSQWVIDNIFSQPCVHCGKTGWNIIGCNRIDNSKPHTMDNVEPCCKDCNTDMWSNESAKQVYQYLLDGTLVKIWPSTSECGKNGYCQSHVGACCRGERKTHKGYRWSYGENKN